MGWAIPIMKMEITEQTDEALLKEEVALVRGQGGNEMSKRLLNCAASDFRKMTGKELEKRAIEAAEGRTVCCETGYSRPTFLYELSNAKKSQRRSAGDMKSCS